jgi:hypothetical protein
MDSYVWQLNTTHNGFIGNCKSYMGWGSSKPNWFALSSPNVVPTITKKTTMCGVEMQSMTTCGIEMQCTRIHHHVLGCFNGTMYFKTRNTYIIKSNNT